jgi:hypothetical protein
MNFVDGPASVLQKPLTGMIMEMNQCMKRLLSLKQSTDKMIVDVLLFHLLN